MDINNSFKKTHTWAFDFKFAFKKLPQVHPHSKGLSETVGHWDFADALVNSLMHL